MPSLLHRKSLILAAALVLALGSSARWAHAQDLDDAIDAELDEVSSGGESPSTAEKPQSEMKSSAAAQPATQNPPPIDDVQLDLGEGDGLSNETQQADVAPKTTAPAEAAPAPEQPAPAIVDDELKMDDEPAAVQVEAPKTSEAPAPVVEEKAPQAPIVAEPSPSRASDVVLDAPNAAYEKRLGALTRGFKQIPDINWDEIIGERRQENYSLQRGDTLWDISSTFFGDGFFWAKLWSQNGVIENPHMILKGKGIRFVAGTEGDAPAIGVMDVRVASNSEVVSMNPYAANEIQQVAPTYREQVQTEVTPEDLENGVVLEADELIPAPELPAAKNRAPILKELPNSFEQKTVTLNQAYDSSGFSGAAPARNADRAASIFVNSFILDGAPNSIGRVEEIESQERVASIGQAVFVRLNRDVPQGSRLTFIRQRASPKGASGPVIDVLGIGIVDGVVKEGTNTYRVTVTTALTAIEKGAAVLADAPPRVTVDRNGRRSEAHVRVVGAEFDDHRKVFGAPSVVYLGGGSKAGLQKGDILGLEARRGTRRDTKYPDYIRTIAMLKIADVRQNVATAIVLSSSEAINIGDVTSGALPERLGTIQTETADEAAAAFGQRKAVDIP